MRDTTEQYSFACEECGKAAATIELTEQPSGKSLLVLKGFLGETTVAEIGGRPVDLDIFHQIVHLAQSSLKELHRLDPDLFGFICRTCGLAYCKNCWRNVHATFDRDWPVW